MTLRSAHIGKLWSGGIRLMREGHHTGNINIDRLTTGGYDLTVRSTGGNIAVSATVTLDDEQLLALVKQLKEAVEAGVDIDTANDPKGAA